MTILLNENRAQGRAKKKAGNKEEGSKNLRCDGLPAEGCEGDGPGQISLIPRPVGSTRVSLKSLPKNEKRGFYLMF